MHTYLYLGVNTCNLQIHFHISRSEMLRWLVQQMGIQDLLTVLCVQEEFSYSYPNIQKDTRNALFTPTCIQELLSRRKILNIITKWMHYPNIDILISCMTFDILTIWHFEIIRRISLDLGLPYRVSQIWALTGIPKFDI